MTQEAVYLKEPRAFSIKDVEEPGRPPEGYAKVRVHCGGVCGTDLGGYLGKMPFYAPPVIPGHELGVEVLEVGPGVSGIQPGDRCSIEPYLNCARPDCEVCQSGGTNCCPRHQTFGVHCDGGWQSTINFRANKLHPSPGKLEFEQLALVETLAIGYHAVQRSFLSDGGWAVVRGAGPIGLSVIEGARIKTDNVVVLDIDEKRLDFCRETMKIKHVFPVGTEDLEQQALEAVKELSRGFLAHSVIDATGNAGSMREAGNYLRHRGSLTYVGIAARDVSFEHKNLHAREATIFCSRNALPDDFKQLIALIEAGRIDTAPWITHRVHYRQIPEVFPSFLQPETGVLKAMVQFD